MLARWSPVFPLWREGDGVREISRRTFLAVYILIALVTGVSVNLLPSSSGDPRVMLALCGGLLLLLPLVWWRVPGLFTLLMHAVTALALLMVTYSAAHTGGIHSPAMVWLSILSVPVLMLRGPGPAIAWIGLIELTTFGMLQATEQGWISAQANTSREGVPWAVLNHVLALLNLMVSVAIYHRLHTLQMKELRARNRELQATHRALLQAQAHKDEFVAAVGHELRTPMNAILGFNSVLRSELADRPEQVEVVDHIRRSTSHLLQVVNEILEFSQLQAGKVQLLPHDFDLSAALRELAARYQPLAHAKGLGFELRLAPEVPAHVHMDRQRLRQVLGLLLDNAIKFTASGQVQLRVSCAAPCLRLEVSDTGCGIALDRQAHIFRRFEHADVQTNRTHGGTGLGLTICEQLVRLHGGRIGLESAPGEGTTFWLELPWRPALAVQATPPEPSPVFKLPPVLDVLVVDDNAVNLMVAQLQLQKIWPQARVVTAGSAAEALQRLDAQAFDLALIDMVMPVMDGPELTRQIRERFPAITARMPIIALTANTLPQEHARCLEAGMDDVVHKPMDAEALVRAVGRQFMRRQEGA